MTGHGKDYEAIRYDNPAHDSKLSTNILLGRLNTFIS